MTISVKVPGKLYLAGEYAVVETGYPAVIAAVDRFVTVEMMSHPYGYIHSSLNPELVVSFQRKEGRLYFPRVHPYELVACSLQVVEEYASELGVDVTTLYALKITSDLDDAKTGKKYGLGSSGAVTVAVIQAALGYYQQAVSPFLVFQLAAIAQTRLGMKGSFGDLAASSFGGVVAYWSVNREWLAQASLSHSVLELIHLTWPDCRVLPITLPAGSELLVGWTGAVARTDQYLGQLEIRRQMERQAIAEKDFFQASKACVERLIAACEQGEVSLFAKEVRSNRCLLNEFAKQMAFVLETPSLEKLCAIAERYNAPAKSSGAGGGDCGICFTSTQSQRENIIRDWIEVGIEPLLLALAPSQ